MYNVKKATKESETYVVEMSFWNDNENDPSADTLPDEMKRIDNFSDPTGRVSVLSLTILPLSPTSYLSHFFFLLKFFILNDR